MDGKIKVLAIVGCTASGKTALAVELAKRLNGEVVSCDSMQIYKGMDVGTAKPDERERDGIPHYMLDFLEPGTDFSCAEYAVTAGACIREIASRGKIPIVCGGTGLYLDSLMRGGLPEENISDPEFRENMQELARQNGAAALHAKLAEVDPESAAAIHPNNIKRVIRALEVYHLTGERKSDADKKTLEYRSDFDTTVIGIRYNNREALYERINRRVDLMIEQGLAEETRRLLAEGVFERSGTAAQAIGYKEILPYIRGEEPLADSVERLKLATRHYAKRQMTWFYAKPYVKWVDADGQTLENIVNISLNLFK